MLQNTKEEYFWSEDMHTNLNVEQCNQHQIDIHMDMGQTIDPSVFLSPYHVSQVTSYTHFRIMSEGKIVLWQILPFRCDELSLHLF